MPPPACRNGTSISENYARPQPWPRVNSLSALLALMAYSPLIKTSWRKPTCNKKNKLPTTHVGTGEERTRNSQHPPAPSPSAMERRGQERYGVSLQRPCRPHPSSYAPKTYLCQRGGNACIAPCWEMLVAPHSH